MEKNLAQELREALNKGTVNFSYEKADGSWRNATGTRNSKVIEESGGEIPKGTGTEKIGTIAYWDIGVNGWRSCREDSIISIGASITGDNQE